MMNEFSDITEQTGEFTVRKQKNRPQITVFNAILTGRQSDQNRGSYSDNLMANNVFQN